MGYLMVSTLSDVCVVTRRHRATTCAFFDFIDALRSVLCVRSRAHAMITIDDIFNISLYRSTFDATWLTGLKDRSVAPLLDNAALFADSLNHAPVALERPARLAQLNPYRVMPRAAVGRTRPSDGLWVKLAHDILAEHR